MRSLLRAAIGIVVTLLVAVSLTGPALPAQAAQPARVAPQLTCDPWSAVSGTVIFGDSITHRSRKQLRARGAKSWKIDAVGGRPVITLTRLVRTYLATHQRAPRVVIIALGTNQRAKWRKADYLAAIKRFPVRTRVVLVTPYRHKDPRAIFPYYARVMAEIAKERPRTTVADWRAAAQANPGTLLKDRYHPSEAGKKVWASRVVDAVRRAEILGNNRDRVMAERRASGAC